MKGVEKLLLSTTFLVLFVACVIKGHITSLNLFNRNDYNTCTQGTPDKTINVTDDGNCHILVESRPDLGLEAVYYTVYTDTATGAHSHVIYEIENLAILERCDCEHIIGRTGRRYYNRSCFIERLYHQCSSFKNNKKTKRFWNILYDDKELTYWGVDVDYMQNYLLY